MELSFKIKKFLSYRAAYLRDKFTNHPAYQAALDRMIYQPALERIMSGPIEGKLPNEMFSGISDHFWFWLHTRGYRQNPALRNILPGMPSEDVQLQFTGNKGDAVLKEGFAAYKLFKGFYIRHVGPIDECSNILDFGCGWGRITRFFIKDSEPSRIWGVDPVEKMISTCKQHNSWCNFKTINTRPPSPFRDDMFDLVYSFSVFSHLSEQMSNDQLNEATRILKPGGMLIATTRGRGFIEYCASLRKRSDLDSIHPGPRSSAAGFMNTEKSLSDYDSGKYCHTQLVHEGEWSYWGETAISKKYVLQNWTKSLDFVDFIADPSQLNQSVIVMKKPVEASAR
jgi:SAM-dependent methyltransferase